MTHTFILKFTADADVSVSEVRSAVNLALKYDWALTDRVRINAKVKDGLHTLRVALESHLPADQLRQSLSDYFHPARGEFLTDEGNRIDLAGDVEIAT